MVGPDVGRALLGWVVFVVLVSAVGVMAAPPGTGAFVLSALMLTVGLACGGALVLLLLRAHRS
jgi:hypothetical protein